MFRFFLIILFVASSFKGLSQRNVYAKKELYRFEGTYSLNPQHQLTLGIFDELNQSLVYLDLKSLKIGALIQISKHTFRDMNDSTMTFSFLEDKNEIIGLEVESNNGKQVAKKVTPHTVTAIAFKSGENTLKGDFYQPKAPSKAAVIFAHGSGPSTRSVGFFTTFFLNLGISVLTFDKQGAGESTGEWETASLNDLANDIQAGIAFLKTKDIDPTKIGIMGNSQGGWTGSIAASRTKDLAFLIARVGAGESVFHTISHEYRGTLLADGFKPQEIAEIMAMYEANWDAARQGKSWEEGNKIVSTYRNKSWFKKIFPEERQPTASASKWWTWLQKNLDYDSFTYLKKVKTPTLWVLGEKDWNVNSKVAAKRVNEALQAAGNTDYTIAILPNMAHNGMTAKSGYYNEPLSFTYASKFWDQLTEWLVKRKLTRMN